MRFQQRTSLGGINDDEYVHADGTRRKINKGRWKKEEVWDDVHGLTHLLLFFLCEMVTPLGGLAGRPFEKGRVNTQREELEESI